MSFNLFGPVTKNDIRVGYISAERGFVDGISIPEANEYAKKNPGTTFIFRNRNIIRYLGINDVNKLTENDLASSVDSCTGIELESNCGPPKVLFYGGGGIGVLANPIIGLDGAVLAVDLVYGGNGYQYPPIVDVKDRCGIGAGAVTRAVLGEVVETFEVYDQEGDFENYELSLLEDVGYGRRYGPNGNDIGSWDPNLYANLTKDPINREIQNYQDFLQNLSKPWWHTRKKTPLALTSGSKVTRTKFNVTDKTLAECKDAKGNSVFAGPGQIWNDFMNTYAISPVPPSNVPGSDFGEDFFTFEWEEDFPYDGEYIFRGSADGAIRDLYIDNVKLATLAEYNQPPAVAKKVITAGVHRIRLDLKNGSLLLSSQAPVPTPVVVAPTPVVVAPTPVVVAPTIAKTVDVNFNLKTSGSAIFTHIFKVPELDINITKNPQTGINKDFLKKVEIGKVYIIEIEVPNNKNSKGEITLEVNGKTLVMEDLKVESGGGKDLWFSASNGRFFDIKNGKEKASCKFIIDDPNSSALVAALVAAPSPQPRKSFTQNKNIFNTRDYINKADRKLWKTNPVGSAKDADFANIFGVLPFDPNSPAAKSQSYAGTHIIRWANIEFPVDGNYTIETWVDDNLTLYIGNKKNSGKIDIGNGLNDIGVGGDEVIIKKNGFTPNGVNTGKSIDTRFFKAGKYRIRAELNQGDFGPLGITNPMSVSINISLAGSGQQLLSQQSWNCNPMGIALTIDAPLPPIPQEPVPQQEGRCPNNPIWSTRFPGSQQKWWPVSYNEVLRANGIIPWSKFLNRYAISPLPPLSLPGTDGGGIVYKNSWQVDIPYDGFYQFAVQRDETARIYLDGKLAFDIKTAGDMIWKDFRNKPKFQKIFITKGRHTISIELENSKTEIYENIDKKVFSTKDWLVAPPKQVTGVTTEEQRAGCLFIKQSDGYYLLVGGNDLVELSFVLDWDDISFIGGTAIQKVTIQTESGPPLVFDRSPYDSRGSISKKGIFKNGKKYKLTFENKTGAPLERFGGRIAVIDRLIPPVIVDSGPNPDQKQQRINFFDFSNNDVKAKLTAIDAKQLSSARVVTSQTVINSSPTSSSKNGVTYSGPPLANYMFDLLSPKFNDPFTPPAEEIQGKTWIMTWSNVDFFEDGQYTITAKVDDILAIKIDGVLVDTVKLTQGLKTFYYNTTKGKKTIQVELSNIRIPNTSFEQNPVAFYLNITKKVSSGTGISKSWVQNPVAISAILIPPPCPKRIRGKGIVTDVIVDDPGNGYLVSQNDLSPEISSTYPVSLRLKDVVVENSGINYNCGVDRIEITPNNGAILDYECDTFGRIVNVKVLNPGLGFTRYPDIRMVSSTGVNASFKPQFEVVRDPIVVDPEKLIQVTDLVGLKQTGYVDGRAYYGAVFYKEGIRYAGFYETPGDLVQVYNTLQESIDARVITPPSAIQRQGTDVTSNDPRLNIPNTPENLI